jgi:Tol biopolymer transport system component
MEESGGQHFLVMELVEGETLAERVARGPIPVEEALKIAHQIAEALEAAHEKGVIHRDLKPANVKITPEGKVKVLDFGLAKALEAEPAQVASNSPTLLSAAAMSGGMILGTAGYMSPEQAKGHSADQRSDIFSFGCVLYEMLTGRQTFTAETVAETLAAVLMREPDLKSLPANLHPKLEDLIRRCLAKDRKERWHAVADVRLEVVAIMSDPRGLSFQLARGYSPRPLWRRALPTVAAVILAVLATAAVAWYLRPSTPAAVTRFSYALPEDQRFTNLGRHVVAMSPDGSSIVYIANRQLYVRKMAETEARPIWTPSSGGPVTTPFFSPDGRYVGFFADGQIQKIAIVGGSAVPLCEANNLFGATWAPDDMIYFGQGQKGILRVSASGNGKPETVVSVKSDELAHGPQLLPGGDTLLFTLASSSAADPWDNARIMIQSLKTGAQRVLLPGGTDARYVPTGHIIYARGQTLLAVAFDAKNLKLTGDPIPIVEDVMRPAGNLTGAAQFGISGNGSLAYISGVADSGRILALIDRAGIQKPLNIAPGPYNHPRISPNGKQLVVHKADVNVQNQTWSGLEVGEIWIYDLTGAIAPVRLTFMGRNNRPIWTRDGQRVVFASDRDGGPGLFSQRADTPGAAELLLKLEQSTKVLQPDSWSKDGTLFFSVDPGGGASTIWMLPPEAGKKPTQLLQGYGTTPASSPDGRWFAYTTQLLTGGSGRQEVFVQPFPPTGARIQVSTGGGHYPVWSHDGTQIFYATDEVAGGSQIIAADVRTQPNFAVIKTRPLPIKGILSNQVRGGFDVTPDDKYFVVMLPGSSESSKPSPQQINITLNWFAELKQRAAARGN